MAPYLSTRLNCFKDADPLQQDSLGIPVPI